MSGKPIDEAVMLEAFQDAMESAHGYRPQVFATGVLINSRDADRFEGYQLALTAAQQQEQAVAVELTVCCGREECGGECGNEWRGMGMYRKPAACAGNMDGQRPVTPDMARDADRCRFLRGDHGPTSVRWPRWKIEHWTGFWNPVHGSELDAAIDAAMREASP